MADGGLDKPIDVPALETPKGTQPSDSPSRDTWSCLECSKTVCYVHLTTFLVVMFLLSDLQVVVDVTAKRTSSLLECYLIAFAGVVVGYYKASPFSAFIQGSMARIAALPYVYHWDMLSSEFYIVLPIIVLLIGVARYEAAMHPFVNDLLLMFDVGVCTMNLMVMPQLWYHWTQDDRGVRMRMFDWQADLPIFGTFTKKVFDTFVDFKQRQLSGATSPGVFSFLPHNRPWGDNEEAEPLLTIRRSNTEGEAPNPSLPPTTIPPPPLAAPVAATTQESLAVKEEV